MGDKIRETLTKTDPETNDKLQNLINTLYKRSTETATTVDIKSHRIVTIPNDDAILLNSQLEQSPELARRFVEEGVLFKQEVTVKQHLPDPVLAKWLYEHLKTEEFQKRVREETEEFQKRVREKDANDL